MVSSGETRVICNEVKYNGYQIESNEIDRSLLDARWRVDTLANPTAPQLKPLSTEVSYLMLLQFSVTYYFVVYS
jgi:hypothetical protein